MRSSRHSSTSCGTCRIDWRPSRMQVIALTLLALLAAGAVLASAVPEPWRGLLAALAAVHGLLLARRAGSEPPCEVSWSGGDAPARLRYAHGDMALSSVAVEFRGPLVRLQGRDGRGRVRRLVWWPDTLDVAD